MFTACPGNFGRQNIFGGFSFGKQPASGLDVAAKMRYKGPESGYRLKQRTVVTEYMTGTQPKKRARRK